MEERKDMELEAVEESMVCEKEKEDTGLREEERGFLKDNRGVGVIEIVLILVILIGLVLIFKEQITTIINNAFASISGDAGKIIN